MNTRLEYTHKLLLSAILLVFVSAVTFVFHQKNNGTDVNENISNDAKEKLLALTDRDLVLNPGKPVTIVVYSDTDCNFCEDQFESVQEVFESNTDTVSVVYRHTFLPTYPRSIEEGVLLACVGKLTNSPEAYVSFKEDLFSIHSSTDYRPEYLLDLASTYADRAELLECQADKRVREEILDVHEDGAALGVFTVPHTFIFSEKSQVYQLVGSQSTGRIIDFINLAVENSQ